MVINRLSTVMMTAKAMTVSIVFSISISSNEG